MLEEQKVAAVQITRRLLFCCVGWNLRARADFLRTKAEERGFLSGCVGEQEGENTRNLSGTGASHREREERRWGV